MKGALKFEVALLHLDADQGRAQRFGNRLRCMGLRVATVSWSGSSSASRVARKQFWYGSPVATEFASPSLLDSVDEICLADGAEPLSQSERLDWELGLARLGWDKGYLTETELFARLVRLNRATLLTSDALRVRTKGAYNKLATQFTDTWYDHPPGEALECLVRHLDRGASVLDAGCGPGHHVAFLKEEGLEPVGLDFSSEMLRIAKANNPNVSFIEGDLVVDPLPRGSFDAVWSAIALNHVPSEDNRAAIGNLLGALKPGGVLGINVQVGRQSELLEYGSDTRFFEYPEDEKALQAMVRSHGLDLLATHLGTTSRNIHGSSRAMTFATVVARKRHR